MAVEINQGGLFLTTHSSRTSDAAGFPGRLLAAGVFDLELDGQQLVGLGGRSKERIVVRQLGFFERKPAGPTQRPDHGAMPERLVALDEEIEVELHSSGVDRPEERIGFARRFAEMDPVGNASIAAFAVAGVSARSFGRAQKSSF